MPICWDDFEIADATPEEFEAIPPRRSGKQPDPRITAILDEVASGGIKRIRVPDESQMRGLRIALSREATKRGFKLDYRTDGPMLYISKSDEPLKPKPPKLDRGQGDGQRKRGRPRKERSESVSEEFAPVPATP